ncbi:MAG: hypothetical protein ABEI86_12345 [Halobacteriaceae archaeon]
MLEVPPQEAREYLLEMDGLAEESKEEALHYISNLSELHERQQLEVRIIIAFNAEAGTEMVRDQKEKRLPILDTRKRDGLHLLSLDLERMETETVLEEAERFSVRGRVIKPRDYTVDDGALPVADYDRTVEEDLEIIELVPAEFNEVQPGDNGVIKRLVHWIAKRSA